MRDHETDLDPDGTYSATHLFIRADERIHGIEAEVANHGKDIGAALNAIKAVEDRVNLGVARTGNENKTEIDLLKTRVSLVERDLADMKKQLFDADTGLVKQFEELRDWQSNFSRNVVTFFIVQCAGGLVLWAVKHFR